MNEFSAIQSILWASSVSVFHSLIYLNCEKGIWNRLQKNCYEFTKKNGNKKEKISFNLDKKKACE